MVQDLLDDVCASVPGCTCLAYADLDASMILVTNAQCNLSRDALNELCASASQNLKDGENALLGDAQNFRLFVRSEQDPMEAICAVTRLDVEVDELIKRMQECLTQLGTNRTLM